MYSGEIEDDDEEEPPVPQITLPDPIEQDVLEKLKALKTDCIQLHKTLETTLQNSGICRRYTIASTSSSRGYRKILSEVQQQKPAPVIVYKNPIRKQTSPRKKPILKVQSNLFIEKHKQELRKYFQKRQELNEKHHLIPLRPKTIKAGFTRKNGTRAGNKSSRRKRTSGKKNAWLQRKTVPEPFPFTLREEATPIKAHYALNFLQKMLDEKEEKEAQENVNRQFRARPPPNTTYVSDSTFYVGKIKRTKTNRQPLIPKMNRVSSRSVSEPAISPRKSPFRAHPVPPSTYIRPSSTSDEMRAQSKAQRSVELLLQSREPFGMKEHAVRSHVQYRIRHYPTCYSPKPNFQPKITKSVPDFRVLQREFANRLHNAREARPSTVIEPFHFHDSKISKHFCDNMKSYAKRTKSAAIKSPAKTLSSRSNYTSATFEV